MEKTDTILERFDAADIRRKTAAAPLICVFNSPKDYPGLYVARLFDLTKPTKYAATAKTLEDIRKTIPAEMICFGRDKEDDPCIVETWI